MDIASCPFCGETQRLYARDVAVDNHPAFAVICDECQAGGPIDDTREQAVANWNRRPMSTLTIGGGSGPQPAGGGATGGVVFGPPSPLSGNGGHGRVSVEFIPDDIAAAREKRDLAGLPSLTTTAEPDGLSMDFDMGGDKPRKR